VMETVIELERVSKRYRLGEHHGAGVTLRERIVGAAHRVRGRPPEPVGEVWSLRDVDLAVAAGTSVGIVGANGAGKSTLLKVINHVTTPTAGRSRTRGRIGSLLEVGTGFHGELTGRENAFLNGAILGMTKREVARRLDEIVAFAGLERFLDTPVKRYSSGMYLRLGFAVAAHMEADILLVDEVLAVGDVEFQQRCVGRMGEIERSGRTVLFVSHNLDAVARLCDRSIWLDDGRVRADGPTDAVVERYLSTVPRSVSGLVVEAPRSQGPVRVEAVSLADDAGRPDPATRASSAVWLQADVVVDDAVPGLDLAFLVATDSGVHLLDEDLGAGRLGAPGRYRVGCRVPALLAPGDYVVGFWIGTAYETFDERAAVLRFTVHGDDGGHRRLVRADPSWRVEPLDGLRPEDAG
jgi:ABC-type polysaccharide/polyol phosphate transport system ATPase subunit